LTREISWGRPSITATVYNKETQQNKPANLQDALTYLNEFLAFDGYEIVPHGKGYDVVDKTRGEIVVDVKLEPSHLSHAFIMEQIEKCRTKMNQGDYDGAWSKLKVGGGEDVIHSSPEAPQGLAGATFP
jgi:NADH:ubiquinone oxidoreductase subunit D